MLARISSQCARLSRLLGVGGASLESVEIHGTLVSSRVRFRGRYRGGGGVLSTAHIVCRFPMSILTQVVDRAPVVSHADMESADPLWRQYQPPGDKASTYGSYRLAEPSE